MNSVLLMLMLVLAVMIVRRYRHDANYKTHSRNQLFGACEGLLDQAETRLDQSRWPVLKGRYAGYRVTLGIVEDTLAWRKLPPLWLLITVHANAPSQGSLDLIVRPANNEFYSPAWQWDGNLPIPDGWPQHAIIKFQRQAVDTALIGHHVKRLFAESYMKELLLTPGMVRLTYMVKQANRGEYLIMRNAVYDDMPIERSKVEELLKQAVAIRQDLENAVPTEKEALHEAASYA